MTYTYNGYSRTGAQTREGNARAATLFTFRTFVSYKFGGKYQG